MLGTFSRCLIDIRRWCITALGNRLLLNCCWCRNAKIAIRPWERDHRLHPHCTRSGIFTPIGFVVIPVYCRLRYHSWVKRAARSSQPSCLCTVTALCYNCVHTIGVKQRLNQSALNIMSSTASQKIVLHKNSKHFAVSVRWSRLPAFCGSWYGKATGLWTTNAPTLKTWWWKAWFTASHLLGASSGEPLKQKQTTYPSSPSL